MGERLAAAGDQAGADACRCHRRAKAQTGRCRFHGGTSKRGKAHHSYKHGFYSTAHQGILARAADAYEAVEALATSHDELAVHKALIYHKLGEIHYHKLGEIHAAGPSDQAVHKALIYHKLGEIHAAGPSDQAWLDLRASMVSVDRRAAGDRQGMAVLPNSIGNASS